MIYYSAERGGFYMEGIHPEIPADALQITQAEHRELLEKQSHGCAILPGQNGKPTAIAPPQPSEADTRTRLVIRAKQESARRIEALAPVWRQVNALRQSGPEVDWAGIDAIRTACDAIEAQIATLPATALTAFDPIEDQHWPQPNEDQTHGL